MRRKEYIAFLMAAILTLASCGAANDSKPAGTSAVTTAAVSSEAETTPVTAAATEHTTTTTAVTTTAAATTTVTTTAETTQSPEEQARYYTSLLTDALRGEKMTDVKQFLIEERYAFEADISMFTEDGESLDHIYNAPSTYDITDIVFSPDGKISLYGVKNRLIPDAVKEIFSDGVKQGFKDKISDKISGRSDRDD